MKNLFPNRAARATLAFGAFVVVSQVAASAQGAFRAFYAKDPVGRNVVSITSSAPLEFMLTRTSAVEADIHFNPANVLDKPRAKFQIDANTLDTGIALRNEHMKSAGWLDTAKYPTISFTLLKPILPVGASRIPIAATPGAKGEMQVEGELDFHGVKKMVQAQVSVEMIGESEATKARLPGDLMHIQATFPLKLDDFGVNIPAMAQTKVANIQDVKVAIFASPGSDAPKWATN